MNILSIETSCDETSVAIVKSGQAVLVNLIASSLDQHQLYGGVVPEIAARDQIKQIIPLIKESLLKTKLTWKDIDKISVTTNPGLISSLLVGINTAQTLSVLKQKPLIKVNHIKGHMYANWLERDPSEFQFPIMILTVSGGHNELMLMRGHGDFELIGETLDDAAGEAFDKVAKMLNLGYPGGPLISRMAEKGNPDAFSFPGGLKQKANFDFSFSGLKTAVLYTLKKEKYPFSEKLKADISASFQKTICETLSKKLIHAAEKYKVKEIHLAGGVSANTYLRELIQQKINKHFTNQKIVFRYPEKIEYCTDNAAMIGAAAYYS